MTYTGGPARARHAGGCHCGTIQFNIDADINEALECNCSHCAAKGFLLAFVPKAQFTLRSGEDNLTSYQFNKKHIDHLFCKTCGVESFAYGMDPNGNEVAAINLRCIDDLDLDSIPRKPFNGKDM